jgi:hypothetical protein
LVLPNFAKTTAHTIGFFGDVPICKQHIHQLLPNFVIFLCQASRTII